MGRGYPSMVALIGYLSGDDRVDYQSHSQSHSRNGSQGMQDRVRFDGV